MADSWLVVSNEFMKELLEVSVKGKAYMTPYVIGQKWLEDGNMSSERDIVLNKWSVLKHYLIEIAVNLNFSPVLELSYLTLINPMNLSLGKKSPKHSKQHQLTKLWEMIVLTQAIYSMNQLLASLFTCLITV